MNSRWDVLRDWFRLDSIRAAYSESAMRTFWLTPLQHVANLLRATKKDG